MSTHTLQAQGRRSTVALPERIEAHMECRPGAKSKNIAPYTRGTKVIGKADIGARQHPGTSMFQKGIPQNLREDKFQNLRASAGYFRKDLRPAKRTRNFRTTRPTKVLLPRSCLMDLEGISNGNGRDLNKQPTSNQHREWSISGGQNSEFETAKQIFTSGCNIYRSSRVRALIPRNLHVPKDKSTCPTGSEHEALIRDYEFLHDVRRYLRVVRQRIGIHTLIKGPVPPEEGMRKIAVFTRLLPSKELLHSSQGVLQKIILQPISNHGAHKQELCATRVLRQEDGSRLSLQCESEIKNSCFRAGQQITYSRFQQIQVIFTSQTYKSCHPPTCEARILNLLRSINLNKPQVWEYPLDSGLSRGN
ncbi:LOW QUALITY PROTEIN: hypothetical protein HID58_059925 [Brassica napus]|uniref:Uncharacterized protein n=1 Tax=Brassica napus TaxID=3708 RepID=A0ABQ7ZU98_BRANA|nr:LOW QUALITY PROTEIN: hypothetical protein HID58_059925 [Brassica napus]